MTKGRHPMLPPAKHDPAEPPPKAEEDALDEALKESFPASDPIAIDSPPPKSL